MQTQIFTKAQRKLWDKLIGVDFLEHFYLAGGTAIALYLGHRKSEDFDFFQEKDFDALKLAKNLSTLGKVHIIQEAQGTLQTQILGTKVSFFHYPYPLIRHPMAAGKIKIAELEDIIPMKLIAISQHSSKKDFIDLYFLLKMGWNLEAMLETLPKKFKQVRYQEMHILKSLVFFSAAENDPMPQMMNQALHWATVKKELLKVVQARLY